MPESKYIEFDLVGDTGKTEIWNILSKASEFILGQIRWYGPWRQYCFYPSRRIVHGRTEIQMKGGDVLQNEWAEDGGDPMTSSGHASMLRKEECKPDYDGMIKSIQEQDTLITELYKAAEEFVFHKKTRIRGLSRTSLLNLIGQCHVQLLKNVHTARGGKGGVG